MNETSNLLAVAHQCVNTSRSVPKPDSDHLSTYSLIKWCAYNHQVSSPVLQTGEFYGLDLIALCEIQYLPTDRGGLQAVFAA